MKKNDIGIPIVNRKELNLILDRIEQKNESIKQAVVDAEKVFKDRRQEIADQFDSGVIERTQENTDKMRAELMILDQEWQRCKAVPKIQKGVLIIGSPGTGKTTIAKERVAKRLHESMLVSSIELVNRYMLQGAEALQLQQILAIDDLGTESPANHFGTSLDVVPHMIQMAYARDKRYFSYFTSNLNWDELNERYGPRVMDRLMEVCYIFILEDTSFRKLSTAEQINEDLQ